MTLLQNSSCFYFTFAVQNHTSYLTKQCNVFCWAIHCHNNNSYHRYRGGWKGLLHLTAYFYFAAKNRTPYLTEQCPVLPCAIHCDNNDDDDDDDDNNNNKLPSLIPTDRSCLLHLIHLFLHQVSTCLIPRGAVLPSLFRYSAFFHSTILYLSCQLSVFSP
jgi:hypothetical protein